ncbi:hypothetical protein HYDPIDRAFT_159448 [Hydnomerulius pinastri MD-312]|uniref:Protein kinase domain-containing protein n=1 Tax=Hydnomerulius pinastri MD-312 TaxID=994086 RepID=A0A0C9V702_9AGAM|nr:hypothetical protein HYDPIDRAFT_159448 [Hydnomerulius pinastri MD-312]
MGLPDAREEDVKKARERRERFGPVVTHEPAHGQPPAPAPTQTQAHGQATAQKKKREPVQRARKTEMEVYGRVFEGCGRQSDYEVLSKLGEGTFGEVHKALQIATNRTVALKRILMHNEKEGMPVTALREIKILKAMKHECVVDIVDMFVVRSNAQTPLSVYMVFPYMDHDLAGLLENERVKLQPSHIKLYMKQLLEGTEYMHRNHILHRDMKAANLLISNTGSLRIADFGLARAFDPSIVSPSSAEGPAKDKDGGGKEKRYTNCVVTRWYRPPELLLGARQYGGEVDVWGIGCVLGEMFMRRPILPGTSDIDQLEKIWQLCGTPNQHTWPNFDALPGCEGVKRFPNCSKRLKLAFDRWVACLSSGVFGGWDETRCCFFCRFVLVFVVLVLMLTRPRSLCSIGQETTDLLDKLLTCNPRERITAAQALDHDYFWTDPLPADPKTLPTYEASHEFDKRGRRNNQPLPLPHQVPPPHPPHAPYDQHHRGGGGGGGRRGAPPPPPGQGQGAYGPPVPGYGPPPPGYGPPPHGHGPPPPGGTDPHPPDTDPHPLDPGTVHLGMDIMGDMGRAVGMGAVAVGEGPHRMDMDMGMECRCRILRRGCLLSRLFRLVEARLGGGMSGRGVVVRIGGGMVAVVVGEVGMG